MFLLKLMGFGFKMWCLFGFQISLRAQLRKDIKRTAFEHASLGNQDVQLPLFPGRQNNQQITQRLPNNSLEHNKRAKTHCSRFLL